MPDWMIYGATGYTGRLIAREAVARGLKPTLGARDPKKLQLLREELGLPVRAFSLDDDGTIVDSIRGLRIVLNCAGPFMQTASALLAACLRAKTSYCDITGEIDVIENAARENAAARTAGVSIIPAVGFDVVPTDCLAAMLAAKSPDATQLSLAFHGTGPMSPGTMKTALAGAAFGGRARIEGRIRRVPYAWKTRTIPFADGLREAQTIPWGDVASAFYTTGIPSIETYIALPLRETKRMRRLNWFAPLLRIPAMLRFAQKQVEKRVHGPDQAELNTGRSEIWGEARNAADQTVSATMTTPNAYRLTTLTAVAAVERLLHGGIVAGFLTPARAFGQDFVLSIPGVTMNWLP